MNMKFIFFLWLVATIVCALLAPSGDVKTSTRPVAPTEEKSCYMPMCEALGGSDTIAIAVALGD